MKINWIITLLHSTVAILQYQLNTVELSQYSYFKKVHYQGQSTMSNHEYPIFRLFSIWLSYSFYCKRINFQPSQSFQSNSRRSSTSSATSSSWGRWIRIGRLRCNGRLNSPFPILGRPCKQNKRQDWSAKSFSSLILPWNLALHSSPSQWGH